MDFLIVGANFLNKGAQSMLFICVDELKHRFPGCSVFFKTCESKKTSEKYAFNFVYYNQCSYKIYDNKGKINKDAIIGVTRSIAKKVLGRGNSIFEVLELSRVIPKIDCMIDISGYNLSSKWDKETHIEYFKNIQMAMEHNIPVYLFPQSFGPFNYGAEQGKMDAYIKKYLSYARIVFAREQEGYDYLVEGYGLNNVRLCPDLVLMNTGVELKSIYKEPYKVMVPQLKNQGYVGIVPNMRSFDHGNKQEILQLYRCIIEELIKIGRMVCLFRHSYEDIEVCRWIKEFFADNDNVLLLENDFSCFEYDEFCKCFDYMIAARYHSIVHAYRNNIPCILLGWAVKYRELANLVGQEKYVFDIGSSPINISTVVEMVKKINSEYKNESRKIEYCLSKVRNQVNCFDLMVEDLQEKHCP